MVDLSDDDPKFNPKMFWRKANNESFEELKQMQKAIKKESLLLTRLREGPASAHDLFLASGISETTKVISFMRKRGERIKFDFRNKVYRLY